MVSWCTSDAPYRYTRETLVIGRLLVRLKIEDLARAQGQRRAAMNPEEYVDRLLDRRERGERQLPVSNDEVAASLAAAEVLTQLREIDVPSEFASYLELYIRARSFGQQTSNALPVVHPRSRAGTHRFLARPAWTAVLGIAAVLLVACIGLLTASARSLPGDTLYGVKQAENQLTLTFAGGPQDRASAQIEQLQSALLDLRTVVTEGRADDAIRLALASIAANTDASRGAVAALPAGAGREAAELGLDGVLAQEEQTVRHLLDQVDWPVRLAFTRQLGALGDAVPTVTQVMVRQESNGTLLITLTGTHFAPHAALVIDGRPRGIVSQSTSQQLVAVLGSSAWSAGPHALGVRNPDGTAAQMVLGDESDDTYNRYATPQPNDDSGERHR